MVEKSLNKCFWPKCTENSEIIYLGKGLCQKHWEKSCTMSLPDIYKKLNIKDNINVDKLNTNAKAK